MSSMAVIDYIIPLNVVKKGRPKVGDIFFPAVGNAIEYARGIMNGF